MPYDFVSDVNIAAVTAALAIELAAVAYLSAAVAAVAADIEMLAVILAAAAIITANPGVAHADCDRCVVARHAEDATLEASIEASSAGGCSSGGEDGFWGSQF